MATTETTSPAVGSVQYDIANNLALGTSSNGNYKVPSASTAPVTPSLTSPTTPITSTSIQPTTPIKLPEAGNTSANAASSVLGTTAGINDSLKATLQSEIDAQKASVTTQRNAVDRNIAALGNRGADQAAAEEAAGIPALQSTARTLADEYNTKTLAYNAQYKSIAQNSSLSLDQRARQLAAVTNEHAYDQTDLAIRSNIAQGNYTAAQSLVDKKIDIKYGGLKDLIGFQTSLLASDQSSLTDKEKTKLGIMLDENKRKLDEVTYQEHKLQDTKNDLIKSAAMQGAPESVKAAIQSAKDPTAAISAAGLYAGDILDRELKRKQLEKTNAEIRKLNRESDGLTVPSVNNPNAAKYKDALNVILGSTKLTKEQKATLISSVNNGEDPFTVIKNQAKNILGATEGNKVTNFEVAKDSLSQVNDNLKKFYAAGGKTNIFSGTTEQVINKLGEVKDPKLVTIATEIAASIQIYRNAVSGTAYSVQEGKQIDSIFPGIKKTEGLNNAIIEGRNKAFDSVIDASYRSALGKTYDEIKKAETNVAAEAPVITPDVITRIDTAKNSGYTDDQIISFLKDTPALSGPIQTALSKGYSNADVVNYLRSFKK